ncbi:MAG: DUF3267 domain-containing protein [Gemmatimonadetes bacterium]|nr:DUF3267 domain-containing protein [Gemmatimonadota bacterium]MDE3259498.1 DUF3267 domain-containing protein [Gemmatimonadota bacterium]
MDLPEITSKDSRDVLTIRASAFAMFLLSLGMFFVAVNAVLVAHWGLSGWNIDLQPDSFNRWVFLGSLVTLVVVHEALHAFAALHWGKVPYNSIRFGVKLKWLIAYCHCSSPMKMGAFRIYTLLPLAVTTVVTGLVLWWAPTVWTLLLFSLAFSASTGDVLIYFKIREFPDDLWVQEHPSGIGCYVWPAGQSPPE